MTGTEREFTQYPAFTVEFMPRSHRYAIHHNGERIPAVSVTSVLKVLDKPALLDWAERLGAEGAVILERRGVLEGVEPGDVVGHVRSHQLGKDAKRDSSADRGTSVHKVLERWASDRSVPNLSDFPQEHRGFVRALCGWLLRDHPEPSSTERVVGSVEHGYAGRMDMRAVIGGRDCIVDLKTNPKGRVYDEAHLQGRAYAIADVECGNPEPEGIVIVAVGEDGSFETDECQASADQWLAVLGCHRGVGALRRARTARWREQQAALKEAA